MERPVIAERVARVIAVECAVVEKDIEPSKRLVDDFGLDSLDLAELQMALEDEFEVDLPASYNDACTVRDIIDLVDRHIKPEARPREHLKFRVNGWVAGKDASSWHVCPFRCQEFGTCAIDYPDHHKCVGPDTLEKPAPEWCPIRNGGIWIEGVECPSKEEE